MYGIVFEKQTDDSTPLAASQKVLLGLGIFREVRGRQRSHIHLECPCARDSANCLI